MTPPENKNGKCAGFAPTDMHSDFLAHTGRSTVCFDWAAISSEQRTTACYVSVHSRPGRW
jgi:hypothetical protein